ncbi:hypothetical protein LIER_33537 [Lithospermum erythrorhizon]|uniref:RING-type E3 ubiquitin transferase n=1 Tax=Lithospermum erythrorhizon TaxID=34254 RepID=A0AAV3RXX3_LITER
MDHTVDTPIYIHYSQAFSPLKSPVSEHGFPVLGIALLGIMATSFLLVSYYIFVTKCFFNWQQNAPFSLRRYLRRERQLNQYPLMVYSPSTWQNKGLDELFIRQLPTFQYSNLETPSDLNGSKRFSKCVVCLTEFQGQDLLRVLPKCNHAFHLDCIDIWLQSNANCPLCRSSISGRNRYPIDKITAPNSSPQYPNETFMGSDEDFVMIDFTGQDQSGHQTSTRVGSSRHFGVNHLWKSKKRTKFHRVSIMGDECINVVRDEDEQFSIQPIRRSFSMDSVVDRHVYLSVQESIGRNRQINEARNNIGGTSSRSIRSIFSFGHGRGSRNAILPVEF